MARSILPILSVYIYKNRVHMVLGWCSDPRLQTLGFAALGASWVLQTAPLARPRGRVDWASVWAVLVWLRLPLFVLWSSVAWALRGRDPFSGPLLARGAVLVSLAWPMACASAARCSPPLSCRARRSGRDRQGARAVCPCAFIRPLAILGDCSGFTTGWADSPLFWGRCLDPVAGSRPHAFRSPPRGACNAHGATPMISSRWPFSKPERARSCVPGSSLGLLAATFVWCAVMVAASVALSALIPLLLLLRRRYVRETYAPFH